MKRCSKCKDSKELICFSKNKSKPDGFSHYCKQCAAECQRKHYQANAEKFAEKQRKYRQANAEKIAEQNRKYYQANPKKYVDEARKRYLANPEKYAEQARKRYQANPEKYAERHRKFNQKQKQEQSANLFFQMAHFASEITKTTITP